MGALRSHGGDTAESGAKALPPPPLSALLLLLLLTTEFVRRAVLLDSRAEAVVAPRSENVALAEDAGRWLARVEAAKGACDRITEVVASGRRDGDVGTRAIIAGRRETGAAAPPFAPLSSTLRFICSAFIIALPPPPPSLAFILASHAASALSWSKFGSAPAPPGISRMCSA